MLVNSDHVDRTIDTLICILNYLVVVFLEIVPHLIVVALLVTNKSFTYSSSHISHHWNKRLGCHGCVFILHQHCVFSLVDPSD